MRTPARASVSFTRRSALTASAVAGAAALYPAAAAQGVARESPIQTAPRVEGRHFVPDRHAVDLPDGHTRHVLSRFTSGVSAERIADVVATGGIDAWFDRQLSPADLPDPSAERLRSWFPSLALAPRQRWQLDKSGRMDGCQAMQDLASWVMLSGLVSKRQVEEQMVGFWSNLLHVASPSPKAWVYRVEYERTVRRHALGRFDDLLRSAIRHPAMGLYLDNVESTAGAVNENLGRELLECHTVGIDGGYLESQVVDSARILTGSHVDMANTWAASYVPADHWVGRVKVMGFSSPNGHRDGRTVLESYLSYLAHRPATARRICNRLAVRFVSDEPSAALVDSLAQVYLDSDTAIVPVLRALVASAEFKRSVLGKVRTPVEDALASLTALRAVVARPHHDQDAANQIVNVSRTIGQVVYDWPQPSGFPDVAAAWTGSGRILGSMQAHWDAASGAFPRQGMTLPPPMDWMPSLPTTFDNVVDRVVRRMLFLPCTPTMLRAACVATEIGPREMIHPTHPLVTHRFPRLAVTILDTPEHLSR
ncbi:MAG: hypothetical protein QOI51_1001 [Nocardioidaceae bacterium]|nr:hypothetical protein [Nocardioidaceae bacterium]